MKQFLFHSLCLQGSSFSQPKNEKFKTHADCSSAGLLWDRLCHNYENSCPSSFKLTSSCINLHAKMIHFCPQQLKLHALDYAWYLANYFARLVSWQRCTCSGRLRATRAINNWDGVEPGTSWGLTGETGRILLYKNLLVYRDINHTVHCKTNCSKSGFSNPVSREIKNRIEVVFCAAQPLCMNSSFVCIKTTWNQSRCKAHLMFFKVDCFCFKISAQPELFLSF